MKEFFKLISKRILTHEYYKDWQLFQYVYNHWIASCDIDSAMLEIDYNAHIDKISADFRINDDLINTDTDIVNVPNPSFNESIQDLRNKGIGVIDDNIYLIIERYNFINRIVNKSKNYYTIEDLRIEVDQAMDFIRVFGNDSKFIIENKLYYIFYDIFELYQNTGINTVLNLITRISYNINQDHQEFPKFIMDDLDIINRCLNSVDYIGNYNNNFNNIMYNILELINNNYSKGNYFNDQYTILDLEQKYNFIDKIQNNHIKFDYIHDDSEYIIQLIYNYLENLIGESEDNNQYDCIYEKYLFNKFSIICDIYLNNNAELNRCYLINRINSIYFEEYINYYTKGQTNNSQSTSDCNQILPQKYISIIIKVLDTLLEPVVNYYYYEYNTIYLPYNNLEDYIIESFEFIKYFSKYCELLITRINNIYRFLIYSIYIYKNSNNTYNKNVDFISCAVDIILNLYQCNQDKYHNEIKTMNNLMINGFEDFEDLEDDNDKDEDRFNYRYIYIEQENFLSILMDSEYYEWFMNIIFELTQTGQYDIDLFNDLYKEDIMDTYYKFDRYMWKESVYEIYIKSNKEDQYWWYFNLKEYNNIKQSTDIRELINKIDKYENNKDDKVA